MPDAKSWRKRRWDTFLAVYNSDREFREKLEAIVRSPDFTLSDKAFVRLLLGHKIPFETLRAIVAFIKQPDLKEKDLYKLITKPITYWNKYSLADVNPLLRELLAPVRQKYGVEDQMVDEFTYDIVRSLFGSDTVITVTPYTGKSELKELVTEFGDDIYDLATRVPAGRINVASSKLLDKIYTPHSQKIIERDRLILELKNKKMRYADIGKILKAEGYPVPDEPRMRRIVYEMRKKLKE